MKNFEENKVPLLSNLDLIYFHSTAKRNSTKIFGKELERWQI
jgi:hypothetical protein